VLTIFPVPHSSEGQQSSQIVTPSTGSNIAGDAKHQQIQQWYILPTVGFEIAALLKVFGCTDPGDSEALPQAGGGRDGVLSENMEISESFNGPSWSQQNHPAILLVEDDMGCRDMFREMIKLAFPEVRLQCAVTGVEALLLLNEENFALVITDILHPGPTGFEILRFLKSRGSALPVIVVAGFLDGSGEFNYAQSLGATACLSKFNPNLCEALTSTMKMLLAQNGAGSRGHTCSMVPVAPSIPAMRFGVAHLVQNDQLRTGVLRHQPLQLMSIRVGNPV
jgi:CheY-like chemotaxis protein